MSAAMCVLARLYVMTSVCVSWALTAAVDFGTPDVTCDGDLASADVDGGSATVGFDMSDSLCSCEW